MILIKEARVYAPEDLGVTDVLVCGGKIEAIESNLSSQLSNYAHCQIIHAQGNILIPGLIDQHVHITGGGGEAGFASRAPEVMLSTLIQGGITTVVGVLGTDGISRSIELLLAKAKALKEEGISAYICTGSYSYPSITLTGHVPNDIIFIEEILGVKLAIADHRAPNISTAEFIRLASDVRTAGMLGKKPGIIVLHMGDDDSGFHQIFTALKETAIPILTFRPTHVNRNPRLWQEALIFGAKGGYLDLTCGINEQMSIAAGLCQAKAAGVASDRLTISSDGQGSWSNYDEMGRLTEIGVSPVDSLYKEYQRLLASGSFSVTEALSYVTANPARALGLYPAKGCIKVGADADLVIYQPDGTLDLVMAGGSIFMQAGKLLRKGTYETWQ